MSERTADPTFQDYSTLTPDKAEDFTFGGHMYHTTNDGKTFLPNAELPGQDIEIGTNEAKTIMAGRNYNAFQDKLRTEQMNRDKPVPIENPQKLEGASPYNVIRAEKQGDTEYHYVDKLPTKPYTAQEIQDYANGMGRVGGAINGAISSASTGAWLGTKGGLAGMTRGAVIGGLIGGVGGYISGANGTLDAVKGMKEVGLTPTKTIQREGNTIFIENTPPREQ